MTLEEVALHRSGEYDYRRGLGDTLSTMTGPPNVCSEGALGDATPPTRWW
jgi:hypothetical protein